MLRRERYGYVKIWRCGDRRDETDCYDVEDIDNEFCTWTYRDVETDVKRRNVTMWKM